MRKRYQLTLTVDTMEKITQFVEEFNLPQNFISRLVDGQLTMMANTLIPAVKKWKEEGKEPTFGDILVILGQQFSANDGQLKL